MKRTRCQRRWIALIYIAFIITKAHMRWNQPNAPPTQQEGPYWKLASPRRATKQEEQHPVYGEEELWGSVGMRCACIICFRYGQANWEEKGGKRPHYSGRSGSRLKPYPTAGSCCFSLPSKSWDDQTMLGSFRRICLCASCFCCSLFPICPSDSLYVSVVSCLSLSSVSPG